MAKILLVCDRVTPTSWQLAQALRAQQHEIYFLTGALETVENSDGIEFMAFFKTWSTLEASRILPKIFGINPQIVHFVLEKDRVTQAHLLIWAYAHARPATVFTLSLLHIEKGLSRRNAVRYLIRHSDVVTCPSIDTLAQLRGITIKSGRQGRGLLPPVLSNLEVQISEGDSCELIKMLSGRRFLLRPFNESEFDPELPYFKNLLLALPHFEIVLLGSQDNWSLRTRKKFQNWLRENNVGDRWYLTGHKQLDEIKSLLKKAEALWLADLVLTPMELTQFFLKSIETSSTLILDPKQARLHAPLWKNGQNCWIIDSGQLQELLKKDSLKLHFKLDPESLDHKDLIDAPINELNRLYNKALSQKANL